MQTIINITVIFIGALIMLASVIKSADLLTFAPLISESRRGPIVKFLKIHRILMSFFLVGYIVVAVALMFDLRFIGELFVSAVFLLGAGFVFMGILLQWRMLLEIRATIGGIVPICSKCSKVRTLDGDPDDRKSWITMEAYLTGKSDARSFCPNCMDELYGLPEGMRPSQQNDRGDGGG
jgi:hypothetical protein